MIQLEYYHFVTFNEFMDIGNDHQWLLTSQKRKSNQIKKRQPGHIMFPIVNEGIHMQISLQDQGIYSPRSGSVGFSRLKTQFLQE